MATLGPARSPGGTGVTNKQQVPGKRSSVPASHPESKIKNPKSIGIRAEAATDLEVVDEIHRRAFRQEDEGRLVRALRDQGFVRVSLVAEASGKVVGHILFSEIHVQRPDGSRIPSLSLAPLAVLPEYERQGIGTRLIQEGLRQSRDAGYGSVFVLGSPKLYGRSGFSLELARPFDCDYAGEHFQAIELEPGALSATGRVVYSEPFRAF